MAKTQTLSFPQGASYLIPFQCRSRGSTPANYTGWKILFVVKKNLTDGDDAALINQLIVPASDTGYNELLLNGDETYEFPVGRYYYQAVVVDATGTVGKSEVGLFVVEETTLRSNAGTYVGPNPPLNPPATAGLIFNARQPIYLDITLITSSGMSAAIYDPQHIQADAFARVNHTGTQAISTVSGLQAALDANSSAISSHITNTSNPHAVTKAQVGLANVDNTADAAKNVLSATKLTTPRTINGVSFDGTGNITITDSTKEPTIGVGTTAQYWRGDKTWQTLNKSAVGLGNVDNTSDADKPASTAVQTALNSKATLLNIPQYALPYRNAAGSGEPNTNLLVASGSAVAGTVAMRDGAGAIHAATATAGTHAVNKTQMDAADADHVAAADPHPQYHNDARGDARYAGQPYAVMAKSQFASLSSSYGTLGRIFGNDGYINDLQVYGLSTQAGTPTPNTPVPIVSTTGNVTVRSAAPSKNLFDGGVGITTGFYYDPFGTAVASAQDYIQTAYIPVLPNTTYTMSHSGSANPKAVQYTSGQTFISRSITVGGTSVTFTTTSNTAFVRLSSATSELATTQLELGPIATTYTPHNVSTQTLPLGTTQLRSLPNGVSDRIYKDGSTWKLERNVGTQTITGAENWVYDTGFDGPDGSSRYKIGATVLYNRLDGGVNATMSERFVVGASNPSGRTDGRITNNYGSGAVRLIFINTLTYINNVASFKAWLATNPFTLQTSLETPVTTTITDPTLITALENIRTYQGVTNITASTPVSGSYGLDLTKTLAGKVDTTGDQTIAGVKTFTSAPIAPSGTSIGGALYLSGTGFPDGVVSAPVGSIYIDKAITNGASSWIKKSGTGNTGWRVLEGDTGWRNITADLTNGWMANTLYIRRMNNQLFIAVDALNASAMTSVTIAPLVTGLQPDGISTGRGLLHTATTPANIYRTTGTSSIIINGASTSTPVLYGLMQLTVTQTWPTTLPGTAV